MERRRASVFLLLAAFLVAPGAASGQVVPIPTSLIPAGTPVPLSISPIPGGGPIPVDLPIPVTGGPAMRPIPGPVEVLVEWWQARVLEDAAMQPRSESGDEAAAEAYLESPVQATDAGTAPSTGDAAPPGRRSPIYVPEAFREPAGETPGTASPEPEVPPVVVGTSRTPSGPGTEATGNPLAAMMRALLSMPAGPEAAEADTAPPEPSPESAESTAAPAAPEPPADDGVLPPARLIPLPVPRNPVAGALLSSVVTSWSQ
jgi:hypothetical protein